MSNNVKYLKSSIYWLFSTFNFFQSYNKAKQLQTIIDVVLRNMITFILTSYVQLIFNFNHIDATFIFSSFTGNGISVEKSASKFLPVNLLWRPAS